MSAAYVPSHETAERSVPDSLQQLAEAYVHHRAGDADAAEP